MEFTTVLLIGVVAYWAFCILVGVVTFGKTKSPADYFVAGRTLGPFVVALAMLATVQSAWMMMGHQGLEAVAGLPYVVYYIHIPLMGLFALFFFAPQWLLGKKFGFISPGEMFGSYYGDLTRILMVVLGVMYVVPYMAMQLIGGGTIFEVLTKGQVPYLAGALLMATVVVIYIFLGGLRAAAITDTFQGILLVLGVFCLAGVVLANLPGGLIGFLEGIKQLPREWRLMPGAGGAWPWQYVLTFAIAPIGIFTSPIYTMWAFSSKTPRVFRWQMFIVWAGIAGFYYFILSPIIGGGGRMLFGLLPKTDALTPTVLMLAPPLLALIIAIAVFAAMNSTADAYMAVISAILSRDVFKHFLKRDATPSQEVLFGRLMVIVVVAIGMGFALTTTDVISLIGGLASAFGLQTIPALLGIVYWRRLTPAGVNAGLVAGLIGVFLTYSVWKYPFMIHCGVWGLAANFVVAYVVSLFTAPVPKETQDKFHSTLREAQQVYRERLARGTLALRFRG